MKIQKFGIIIVIVGLIQILGTVVYGFQSLSVSTFTCYGTKEGAAENQLEPEIVHTLITSVDMVGNNIDIVAEIRDDVFESDINNPQLLYSSITYTVNGTFWGIHNMPIIAYAQDGSTHVYTVKYTIPKERITSVGTIEYRISYGDGLDSTPEHNKFFPISTTQTITVTQTNQELIGSEGGSVVLADANTSDGQTSITIPVGALTSGTVIKIIQKDANASEIPSRTSGDMLSLQPISAYEFDPTIRFLKMVTVSLLYVEDSTIQEEKLRAFYYDGFEWRLLGGKINTDINTVTFKIDHFSLYAIFPAKITADTYRPKERIITPAYIDGKNDYAQFDGLNGTNAKVKIYDAAGREIRIISDVPYRWDGTDADGNIVESGVYIYQFKADIDGKNSLISGTIAVAK